MTVVASKAFETGSVVSSYFDSVGDAGSLLSIDTAQFRAGGHSLRFANTATVRRADHNLPAGTKSCCMRQWIRFDNFLGSTQPCYQWRNGVQNGGLRVSSGGVVTAICGAATSSTIATLSLNTWYLMEMVVDCTGTTWTTKGRIFDIDGNAVGSEQTASEGSHVATDITQARWGISNAITGSGWIDDIEVDTGAAYIGWDFTKPRAMAMAGC